MALADKLVYLLNTKMAIKEAIESKGKSVPENTTFRGFADLIKGILTVNNQEKSINITANGTTTVMPDANKTGLAKVTVTTNVNTVKNQNKTQSITANGTVTVKPDSGYTGLGQVTINTNVQKALTAAGKNVMSAPASSLATSITAPPGISMLILTCAANRAEANSTPSVSGTNITLQSRTAISTSRANIYSNEIVIEKTWACKIQNTSSSNKAVNISWANSGAIMLTASLVAQ